MPTRDGAETGTPARRFTHHRGRGGGQRAPPEHSPGAGPPPTCSQEATADAPLTWPVRTRAGGGAQREKQRTAFVARPTGPIHTGSLARLARGDRRRRGARRRRTLPPARRGVCAPGTRSAHRQQRMSGPRNAHARKAAADRRATPRDAREQAPLARSMHRALPPSVACRGSAAPAGVTAADEHAPGGPRGRCAKPGRRVAIADAAWPAAGHQRGESEASIVHDQRGETASGGVRGDGGARAAERAYGI
ncbi:hypothetical protein PHLGIDRAFT_373012 [Phlebiopsis gigantea 11061_1 CR5-6]|uniref:Uncharacterized protein n=1 Tax=Phlebiopsis gigantea (strain 11061_1 CR5-6) TaxID=745531 RepID=A0A0C3PP00_PHLG1|nr:hypothetical protein PHLGIDRAFT_373012 [Phlebiopsis gigantea 11061_1 CR5-6]